MSPLRLAWLRARGRVEVRGRPRLERGVRIAVAPGARVVLEDGCRLGERCRIEARGGTVRIGPRALIGERSILVALAGIDVGADSAVGAWAALTDAEPTYADPERPTRLQPLRAVPIRIGDRARVGPHTALLPGAAIAPGAMVGAYEVVDAAPRSSP